MHKPTKLVTSILMALMLGFFVTSIFATNEEELKTAIQEENSTEVERLLKDGVDPRTAIGLLNFPSVAMSGLLLNNKKNPLNPDEFINWIMKIDAYDQDQELLKYSLVKLALEKGGDPQAISYFHKLPSIALSELLLKNKTKPFHPDRFLNLLFSSSSITHEEMAVETVERFDNLNWFLKFLLGSYSITNKEMETVAHCDNLIKLALANGGKLAAINFPFTLPSLAVSKLLLKHGLPPTKFLELVGLLTFWSITPMA